MLVIMTVEHIKSPVSKLTNAPFGFFTSAMGFVFLSGLVAGIVAQNKSGKPNINLKEIYWKRSYLIFKYHLATFFIIYIIGFAFYLNGIAFDIYENFDLETPILTKITMAVLLLDKPKYLDILPMYFVFIFALPFIIYLVKEKKSIYLILISGLIYILAQYFKLHQFQQDLSGVTVLEFGGFDLLAWQFIFILGVVLGMLYEQGQLYFLKNKTLLLCSAVIILCTTIFRRPEFYTIIISEGFAGSLNHFIGANLRNFGALNLIQLSNFLCFSLLMFNLIQFNIIKLTNKWLTLLGQHSLQVFTFHIFLSYLALMLRENLFPVLSGRIFFLLEMTITVFCLAALFIFVNYRSKKITNKKLAFIPK